MDLNELANRICRELPEPYSIRIDLENGCGVVELWSHDPLSHVIDINSDYDPVDGTIEDDLIEALGEAWRLELTNPQTMFDFDNGPSDGFDNKAVTLDQSEYQANIKRAIDKLKEQENGKRLYESEES